MKMGTEGRGRYCPPRHGKSSLEEEFPEHGTERGSTKQTQSLFSAWSRQDHVELRCSNNPKWNNNRLVVDNYQFKQLRDVLDGCDVGPSGPGQLSPFTSAIRTTNSQIPWTNLSPCQSTCVGEAEGRGERDRAIPDLGKEGEEFPRQGSMGEGTSGSDM